MVLMNATPATKPAICIIAYYGFILGLSILNPWPWFFIVIVLVGGTIGISNLGTARALRSSCYITGSHGRCGASYVVGEISRLSDLLPADLEMMTMR